MVRAGFAIVALCCQRSPKMKPDEFLSATNGHLYKLLQSAHCGMVSQ